MLDNAALALLTATTFQTVVKMFLPDSLDNNIKRAVVGVVAYLFVLLNAAAGSHVHNLADAWGLIPQAGIVAAGAIAGYHILADVAAKSTSGQAVATVTALDTPPLITSPQG